MNRRQKEVSVDFDATLHPYTAGWTGPTPEDEPPIEGAEAFLKALLDAGFKVTIFSTRAATEQGRRGIVAWFFEWMPGLKQAFLRQDVVVSDRKGGAVAFVDDRAVVFRQHGQGGPNYSECLARVRGLELRAHGQDRKKVPTDA